MKAKKANRILIFKLLIYNLIYWWYAVWICSSAYTERYPKLYRDVLFAHLLIWRKKAADIMI